jgi:hypothetical protein
MSYREKIAWLSLIAMAVTYVPYFILTAVSRVPDTVPNLRQLSILAAVSAVRMLILGIGHLHLRRTSDQEARMPPDERDRAIERQSLNSAYYVLIAGMIAVGCVMPFYASGWRIINSTLFMIVLAEVVQYGLIVVSYRRQQA